MEKIGAAQLDEVIQQLAALAESGEVEELVNMLDEVVPGARIKETPSPDLTAMI